MVNLVFGASVGGAAVQRGLSPKWSRTCLGVVIALGVIGSWLLVAATPQAAATADPALTRLLRAMAMIKTGMAASLLAGVFWRLGAAVSSVRLAAYALASAAMVSGPVLIWGMTSLLLGALLLHGGLIAGAVLLWQDPATAGRLQTLIARRRAKALQFRERLSR